MVRPRPDAIEIPLYVMPATYVEMERLIGTSLYQMDFPTIEVAYDWIRWDQRRYNGFLYTKSFHAIKEEYNGHEGGNENYTVVVAEHEELGIQYGLTIVPGNP